MVPTARAPDASTRIGGPAKQTSQAATFSLTAALASITGAAAGAEAPKEKVAA